MVSEELEKSGEEHSKPPIPAEIQKLDAKTRKVVETYMMSFHSGPIPPAQVLAEYEEVCPGLAREIVTMAQDEQRTRLFCHTTDAKAITRGQWCGLACFLASMGVAAYMASTGSAGAGATVATAAVTGFSAIFVLARHKGHDAQQEQASQRAQGKKPKKR